MSGAQLRDRTIESDQPWFMRMADSMLQRHVAAAAEWHYEHGLLIQAIDQVGRATGEARFRDHAKATIDLFVEPSGGIRTYRLEDYNLDQINPGKQLFALYRDTGDERYKLAAALLRQQLARQPQTNSGGFWHKQIYPHQMWLDGIYMAAPFYAAFARTFDEPSAFDDIAQQITLIERQARDPHTGLLYHAWDESRQQRWADPQTGCSPHFWGRAMGWYAMALVDVLDQFPAEHPRHPEIVAILGRLAAAAAQVQDAASGLWYQVLDQGQRAGNYHEASASCMFVYALAKGVRQGYLPASYLAVAQQGYDGIVRDLITVDAQGLVTLERVCAVAGLGGNPYRDGSFAYYVGERVAANDYKGVGPFILASLEIEGARNDATLPHAGA